MSNHGKRVGKGVCPRCHGSGLSRAFNRKEKFNKTIIRKTMKLFKNNLPLREIAEKIGVKHPQTVKYILKKI